MIDTSKHRALFSGIIAAGTQGQRQFVPCLGTDRTSHGIDCQIPRDFQKLPEEYDALELGPAPPRTFYKGLNKYFVVERGGVVPKGLAEWAGLAYQNVLAVEPLTAFMDRLTVEQLAARKKGRCGGQVESFI